MICPLCKSKSSLFEQDKKRHYYQCSNCNFVFVDSSEYLSLEEENRRYKLHNNSLSDPRYHEYLTRVRDSFLEMNISGEGVDIGCGETTLLADLFKKVNLNVLSYDPLFFPNEDWKNGQYNFFTMSEVIEHLSEPLQLLNSLKERLYIGGKILIKTEFIPDPSVRQFKDWYYKGDDTHVHFYSERSALELAFQLKMEIQFSRKSRGIFSLTHKV